MQDTEIGTVTTSYNQEGEAITIEFKSSMYIKSNENLLKQLRTVKSADDIQVLQTNSDLAVASWFSKITEIELTDPSEGQITSEIVSCDKYPNGKIQTCVLKYTFRKFS
jgi:hypothetical protein